MSRTRTHAASAATAPPPLYKYRSLLGDSRARTEDIIRNGRLWYSKASSFNDPFDCNLMIAARGPGEWEALIGRSIERAGEGLRSAATEFFRKSGREVPSLLRPGTASGPRRWEMTITDSDGRVRDPAEFFNSHQERRLRRMYEILDSSFGVLSLSSKPDDILMWSHYANGHDGVCLEFETSRHPRAFPRLHPVRYEQKYPYVSPHFPDVLSMMRRKGAGTINRLLLDVAHVLAAGLPGKSEAGHESREAALGLARWFYVKSRRWEYEQEWRALSDGPGPVTVTGRALTRIIAGCVNTDANLDWARQIVSGRRPAVRLARAVKKAREFGLDIVPVD